MSDKWRNSSNVAYLKALLDEQIRIEKFLRAEVRDLWAHLEIIQKLPLLKLYIKFVSKIKKLLKPFNKSSKNKSTSFIKIDSEDDLLASSGKSNFLLKNLEILFILPTNNLEIGGIHSTLKLANFLASKGVHVKIHNLTGDPTVPLNDIFISSTQVNNLLSLSIVVACGSETVSKANEVVNKFNSKSVIYFQGPDHYFEKNWSNSESFIKLFPASDLVIAISKYLCKMAKNLNATKVLFAPIGLDTKIFNYNNEQKENVILIPCRVNSEKGTQFVIPLLAKLRKLGWRVVGFGELSDKNMANEFDDFLGHLDSKELSLVFKKSKFLLDPSLVEGLGLVPLEAAACGCFPIITKRHSYDEMFPDKLKPYLEVVNFLEQSNITEIINEANDSLDPKEFSDRIKFIDWNRGYSEIYENLLTLIK